MIDIDHLQIANTTLVFIGALASGVAGVYYLSRRIMSFVRRVESILTLTSLELRRNGGNSIKDLVERMPDLERRIAKIEQSGERLEIHVSSNTRLLKTLTDVVPLLAMSRPPDPQDPQPRPPSVSPLKPAEPSKGTRNG